MKYVLDASVAISWVIPRSKRLTCRAFKPERLGFKERQLKSLMTGSRIGGCISTDYFISSLSHRWLDGLGDLETFRRGLKLLGWGRERTPLAGLAFRHRQKKGGRMRAPQLGLGDPRWQTNRLKSI